ncbi:carboxymuconolactone decarboxylase family protein [Novosphingobium profundi]|uniref:carboxymuconolactone decarboxylase family protein n=1 Tax=Novosphingobium profundi TaxID=1774954 RepID=UPI001CFE565B|nr:carboxymuconolactone decarboxylase family protein [Novosphingobium profundi]
MSTEPEQSPAIAEIMRVYEAVPEFERIRRTVLMGDLWEQGELPARERSLVTCALLAASNRRDELESHVAKAIGNGVTPDELRGLIVHLAFYAGWPSGLLLGRAALPYLEASPQQQG